MALITCPDCGNQMSSEAAACARCGSPVGRRQAPPTSRKASVVVGGVVAFGLVIALAAALRPNKPSGTPPAPVPPPRAMSTGPDPMRGEAEARMNAAAEVWYAYMKLPPEKQTKQAWKDALVESTSKGEGLRPPYEALFQRENTALARKYAAGLITIESRATGEEFTVLVPSPDPTKCALWASQWLVDPASLRTLGFTKIRCEGSSRKSAVTGNALKDPDQEWPVP